MRSSSLKNILSRLVCAFIGHADRNYADADRHYAHCIRCGKIFGNPWQSDRASKEAFDKTCAVMKQMIGERDVTIARLTAAITAMNVSRPDDAATRWYAAASPYATPEALKEALTRFRAAPPCLHTNIQGYIKGDVSDSWCTACGKHFPMSTRHAASYGPEH